MRESFQIYFLHRRIRRRLDECRRGAAAAEAAQRQRAQTARAREKQLRELFLMLDSDGRAVFQRWLESSGEFSPAQIERILAAPDFAPDHP